MTTQTLNPYKFEIDGKALRATAHADGDLLLEGWAARWDIDRENEAFDPASFDAGIKSFIDGTAALCFHHDPKAVLGRVLSLERRPEGLWMQAKVDGAIRRHPTLGTIYEQVRKGTITGASVGGFFRRALKAGRRTIVGVDLTEVSLTGVPVGGHNTRLAVVAGKALSAPATALDAAEHAALLLDLQLVRLEARAASRAISRV